MVKKYFLSLLLTMFIFTSCNAKTVYSKPTTANVNEFISKKSVKVLAIEDAIDFTVVLYEHESGYGHYKLYKDQHNKLYVGGVRGHAHGDFKENPISTGGVASGKTPFITVVIDDEDILQKAKELEIVFNNGSIVKQKIDGRGIIVLYNNEKGEMKVKIRLTIYDKDMKILYED